MNSCTTVLSAVAALVLLAGCRKETPIEKLSRPDESGEPSSDPVRMEVTADPNAKLGEEIVFHVKLTNSGSSAVQVNIPRIDRRSLVLRVRRADGGTARLERIHAELDPRGQFLWEAPETRQLAAGESFTTDVPVVAVQAGKLGFTPSYTRMGAPAPIVSPVVDVEVTPADPEKPRLGVLLETSHGPYSAVLRPDVAYNTVESFASLVRKGFYTGVKFHRIIKGFMAQGGDPQGTGMGGPGYYLPMEADTAKLPHRRGVLSMARTGVPDTAGSQFFIMFGTNPSLDKGPYTTFGEMAEGEETLKKLENVPTGPSANGEKSAPSEPVLIQRATLVPMK